MRRAANIDANQRAIVKALRNIPGIQVEPGHDDILVGYKGVTYWFEIKNPDRCLNKHGEIYDFEITPAEHKRLETWTGHYEIVWSLEQILKRLCISGEEYDK